MVLLEVVRSAHVYILWEGIFCPHFLFLHTSFLSQCTQACTAVLVGGITHCISKPKIKEEHYDHAQPTKLATNIRRNIIFMQDTFSTISTRSKTDWTENPSDVIKDTQYSMTIPVQNNLTFLKQFNIFKFRFL